MFSRPCQVRRTSYGLSLCLRPYTTQRRNLARQMEPDTPDYSEWNVEDLAKRVKGLEKELREANAKLDRSYLTFYTDLRRDTDT